jgi:hypothetical protein
MVAVPDFDTICDLYPSPVQASDEGIGEEPLMYAQTIDSGSKPVNIIIPTFSVG